MPRPKGKLPGLSFDEIAERLDMPRTTVQAIARRALVKMRDLSEAEGYSFDALFDEPKGRPR